MYQELLTLWPQAIGYFYATIVAQRVIWPIMKQMWLSVGAKESDRPRAWQSGVLGTVERVMFVGSIQLEKPEFIGVWLVIKVASQWARWGEGGKAGLKKGDMVFGRDLYNIFLLGNALSVIFSAVGALMIKWLADGEIFLGVAVPIIVLATSGILLIVIKRYVRNQKGNRA